MNTVNSLFYALFSVNGLRFTADYVAEVFHPDGSSVVSNGWVTTGNEELASTCVIAIKAANHGGSFGLIASTDTGLVTDASWRCTAQEDADWFTETFDDSHWPSAHVWYEHGDEPYGVISDVDISAKWIWTDSQYDLTVYCRKQICPSK